MYLSAPLFFSAVALLFLAHLLRCYRHTLLFPDKLLTWRFDLLLGLALSHLVNVLLPWRVGDVVRIAYVARRYRMRGSYVAATVGAERLSDITVVLLLSCVMVALNWAPPAAMVSLIVLLAAIGVVLVGVAVLVTYSKGVRQLTWKVSSLFNDRIRFFITDMVWSFSQLVTGRSMLRREFILLTFGMWALYLGSYAMFAVASGTSFVEVGLVLLGGPSRSLLQQILNSGVGQGSVALFLFTALPVIAVLLYGAIRNNGQIFRSSWDLRKRGFSALAIAQPIAGDRFSSRIDYDTFLYSHFTGKNAIVSQFGMIAAPNVLVVRLLPGGSDAVTAMIEDSGVIKIRKCATGNAGEKLAEQANWLREHEPKMPLAQVIGESRPGEAYSFDMPYLLSARDFYEVIHTAPVEESARIITEVVDTVHAFHKATSRGAAAEDVIASYLQQKVKANAEQIHEFACSVFPDKRYQVNGVEYHLDEWERLFDTQWLRAQIGLLEAATIHGDLTIENIIVSSEVERGWYLIDPNPANVFNTPLIDWAKLMQSLHLGYEGLNRAGHSVVKDKDIKLLFLRSNAYASLHQHLSHYLESRFGAQAMREIAFHELVNYLRLTPYKIRHHPQKALTFFACTSVLLRRYVDLHLPVSVNSLQQSELSISARGAGALPGNLAPR